MSYKKQLIEKIANASRIAFKKIIEDKPDEQFFSFSLVTLDDVLCCYAYANSKQSHQRTIQNNNITPNSKEALEYKWSPQEWEYECLSQDEFNDVYDLSESIQEKLDEDDFYSYKLNFIDCMEKALKTLDNEGIFGTGDKRNTITLFISISDSFMAEEIEMKSKQNLNPQS